MRVALILLFLLSLGAIPGSVIPQTPSTPSRSRSSGEAHTLRRSTRSSSSSTSTRSVWFSAIYILLFVSLAGCIVPRTWQFVGQLRARPPRAPRRLDRMPAYTTWHTDADAGARCSDAARELLGAGVSGCTARRRRGRRREGLSARGGQSRLPHRADRAAAGLRRRAAVEVRGRQADRPGRRLLQHPHAVRRLQVRLPLRRGRPGPLRLPARRLPRHVRGERPREGHRPRIPRRHHLLGGRGRQARRRAAIEVNHPLEIGGSKVYLIGNGYAPVVTVKDGKGKIAYRGPVAFLPQDTNLTSTGVVKVTDYRDARAARDQLGFQGFFVPTFGGAGSGTMFSQSPA